MCFPPRRGGDSICDPPPVLGFRGDDIHKGCW
jgi:hypothetical protein